MSLRAYARHRGDALSAVQKAIADGRVSAGAVRRDETGRLTGIDQEIADRDWASNTDPVEALKNHKWPAGLLDTAERQMPESLPAKDEPPASAADSKGYLDARTREKEFQAKQAELNYLERVGELVSAADVRGEQIEIYRELRDKLEQLPARVSQKLAAETDPQRIEHALSTEIRITLNELSRTFAGDAADPEGIAERASVPA